ncbi:ABC transporter permease [Terrimonas rubra]|uniref:ABC transporter permease n=1 Tax=Terrimonas rubra TaxID=1035890 RepID=A0ABW6A8H1_9BACT
MNKTILIIKREFLTRVRKRTFIISTLLFPLLYLGLVFGMGYIGEKSKSVLKIAVIDSSGLLDRGRVERANAADVSSHLNLVTDSAATVIKNFEAKGYDGYLVLPAGATVENGLDKLILHTGRTLGSAAEVQMKLGNILNEIKYEKLGIDETKRKALSSQLTIKPQNVNDEKANSNVASTIGMVSGFLIYFILLIYGSQVMMGVMEEKTNRIAEVMVSSVKPFQLMLGKIVGIGLVAFTQFILWIAFIFIIYNATKVSGGGEGSAINSMVGGVQEVFTSLNLPLLLGSFAFYFMGGFFFYSSLYAAIGSAVNEDMREAQSLSFPVTMIVIFAIMLMTIAIKDPSSPVAVWGSIIPFTSPIVMMARIPFGVPGTVPVWQLALSVGLLIGGFAFTTWFAGKIYRTGILMYGKKPSWKEMLKWAFRK